MNMIRHKTICIDIEQMAQTRGPKSIDKVAHHFSITNHWAAALSIHRDEMPLPPDVAVPRQPVLFAMKIGHGSIPRDSIRRAEARSGGFIPPPWFRNAGFVPPTMAP